MTFDWNPAKSAATLAARGFDFAFAARIFEGRTVETEDRRHDYGERRIVAIGAVDGLMLTVVYTDRPAGAGIVRHIITAWRSNRRDQARYHRGVAE